MARSLRGVGYIGLVAAICVAALVPPRTTLGQHPEDPNALRQELDQLRADVEKQRAAIAELRETVERLQQERRAAQQRRARTDQPRVVTVNTDHRPSKGHLEAPLTLVEFSDFQCPYCSRFFRDVLPALERELIATGKVRFVYRHYPLPTHSHARGAAQAAICAHRQGKFWEMHDWLFANQTALNESAFDRAGRDLELDAAAYDACRESPEVKAEVEQDVRDAVQAGVRGTPAFVLGRSEANGTVSGEVAVGVYSIEEIREQVEALTAAPDSKRRTQDTLQPSTKK